MQGICIDWYWSTTLKTSVSIYRMVLAFSFRQDTMHPKGPRIVCFKYTCQVFSLKLCVRVCVCVCGVATPLDCITSSWETLMWDKALSLPFLLWKVQQVEFTNWTKELSKQYAAICFALQVCSKDHAKCFSTLGLIIKWRTTDFTYVSFKVLPSHMRQSMLQCH